jgi:hypothetical protein
VGGVGVEELKLGRPREHIGAGNEDISSKHQRLWGHGGRDGRIPLHGKDGIRSDRLGVMKQMVPRSVRL